MNLDPYALLAVPVDASPAEIKAAYHRVLREAHPDKRAGSTADIAAIQEAYRVLSTPDLRAKHDGGRSNLPAGPRPAQLISLAEFDEGDDAWAHACRCGGVYKITVDEMEQGQHLVPCSSCSEVVWVGYELADDE
ncbi:hypothetical protein B0H11DRAFT_1987245 [Mycena galericulata]|nr:hypothetical protein B0H11DRAFT_1987245 [Mycena galericulata]